LPDQNADLYTGTGTIVQFMSSGAANLRRWQQFLMPPMQRGTAIDSTRVNRMQRYEASTMIYRLQYGHPDVTFINKT
jgi:hypothetical protein